MVETTAQEQAAVMQRFIDLANQIKNEDIAKEAISTALMAASAVYATYCFAGNEGGLNASGVERVSEAYRQTLKNVQAARRAEFGAK